MRPSDKIERLIQETNYAADAVKRKQILSDASQALRQYLQESPTAKPAFWRTIIMYPLTKYAIAALVVIAAGLFNYLHTGSVDMATIAFADISEAMKKVPWMHQVSRGKGVAHLGEQWFGFESRVFASKAADGKVSYWDISEKRMYEYDPNSRHIEETILGPNDFPLDMLSPLTLLESMNKMLAEQGAEIVTKTGKYNGQTVQIQDISLEINNISQKLSLYIDPIKKLLIKADIKYVDADGNIPTDGEALFDYPLAGPATIYDLGVPREEMIKPLSSDILFKGQLIDSLGNGIKGTVTIGWSCIVQSDQQGFFVVPRLRSKHFYGNQVGYGMNQDKTLGKHFYWKTDQKEDIQITLEPLISIQGRMVDLKSNPVKDAKIQLCIETHPGGHECPSATPWKMEIKSDGSFCFSGVPIGAAMEILAEKPGLQGSIIITKPENATDINVGDLMLKPLPGFETETTWDAMLSGCVTSEKNEPMPGLEVNISSLGMKILKSKTNRKGQFTIKGLPRDKNVSGSVYAEGYGHTMFKIKTDGSELNLQLFPQGYDLLNKPAPGLFAEKWFNTEPVTLEQYRGKVILLQIGAILPIYQRHFETIQKMNEKYSNQGLGVIVLHARLTTDWAGPVTEEEILAFIRKYNIQFPFGIDDKIEKVRNLVPPDSPSNGAMYALYDIKVTPALYLIDKKGLVRISPTEKNLEQWIKTLLAE
jgi:hypothetical protein